ncbi:hypothetical protein GOODEAATRI_020224 [Goodea atripinnis]|uniref:Secreted protein n=1 Tax=Goodea atripinnis TaxID=208336 RepID=A0ABV0PZJ7_9TELE
MLAWVLAFVMIHLFISCRTSSIFPVTGACFLAFFGDTTSGRLATVPVFKNVCGEARARSVCVGSCRRRGSEWVKADDVTVLSVLLGAVPAHLLPPSLRAEPELQCVCAAVVILEGHTPMRNSPLCSVLVAAVSGCLFVSLCLQTF